MPKARFVNFKSMQIKERLKYLTILIVILIRLIVLAKQSYFDILRAVVWAR